MNLETRLIIHPIYGHHPNSTTQTETPMRHVKGIHPLEIHPSLFQKKFQLFFFQFFSPSHHPLDYHSHNPIILSAHRIQVIEKPPLHPIISLSPDFSDPLLIDDVKTRPRSSETETHNDDLLVQDNDEQSLRSAIGKFISIMEIVNLNRNDFTFQQIAKKAQEASEEFHTVAKTYVKYPSICPIEKLQEMQSVLDGLLSSLENDISQISTSDQTRFFLNSLNRHDMKKLKHLFTSPNERVFTNDRKKEFYYPRATVIDLSSFFQPFVEMWKFLGASVHWKKSNHYNTKFVDKQFTAIYFRKREQLSSSKEKKENPSLKWIKNKVESLSHYLNITHLPKDQSCYTTPEDHLRAIDLPLQKWGYSCVHIGNVNKDFLPASEFGTYLLLFYKDKSDTSSPPSSAQITSIHEKGSSSKDEKDEKKAMGRDSKTQVKKKWPQDLFSSRK